MRLSDALGRASASETVIPFAPTGKQTASGTTDSLDAAGQKILSLLHQAAGMAEENSRHAVDVAQKLSLQLQSVEDRIKDLEADVRYFQGGQNGRSNGFLKFRRRLSNGFSGLPMALALRTDLNTKRAVDFPRR